MYKFYTILLITVIIGCNSSGSISIESLIENNDLDELKKRKDEYVEAMNAMKLELNEINSGIAFLDENERLALVSEFAGLQEFDISWHARSQATFCISVLH